MYSLLDKLQLWNIEDDGTLKNKASEETLWEPNCSRCKWNLKPKNGEKSSCQWRIDKEGKFEDQKLNMNKRQGCAHTV